MYECVLHASTDTDLKKDIKRERGREEGLKREGRREERKKRGDERIKGGGKDESYRKEGAQQHATLHHRVSNSVSHTGKNELLM